MADGTTFQEEEALGKAYDARLMRRLLKYLKPYRWHVAGALLVLLLGSWMAIIGPWVTQRVIDEAIPTRDRGLLIQLIAIYGAAITGGFILEYARALVTTWLGQSVMYDLRKEIFEKLQRADLRFYDRNPIGRLMTRITNDVETLNTLFSSGLVTVFGDIFTLAFIIGAMLTMNWRLALVSFSILPFVFWAAFLFRSRIRTAYRDIRVRIARINAFLQERITGVRVVQLFNREAADAGRLAAAERGSPAGPPPLDYLLRALLPRHPVLHGARPGADPLVRRASHARRIDHGRRDRCVPAVRPTLLSPHSGPVGEVQRAAGCHGFFRAGLPAPRRGHRDRGPGRTSLIS